jgi:hypothetical protein
VLWARPRLKNRGKSTTADIPQEVMSLAAWRTQADNLSAVKPVDDT